MSIEIKRSDKYVDYNISATNNRGYITIDTSDWINKPWMFYELPALKFEIYTETNGELVKYQNFSREIRTYNPVYSPLGVLNVTIDIRNVPEEFILRITPIFDNDAIAARNMLIENGIENGEIWGKDQDIPTQSFDLNIEFIECEGEYVPPTPPVPPTHEETITGIPPITFDGSTGEPIVSWTILGNGQQTGTPSPDNIIMPTFCGKLVGTDWTIPITCAGQITPVYLGQVRTVRRVKKLVLYGTENWDNNYGQSLFGSQGLLNSAPFIVGITAYSTHFKYNPVQSGIDNEMSNGEFALQKSINIFNLFFKNTAFSSTADFKAWLSAQYAAGTPVTVWYVLAEPTTGIVNEPLAKIGDYADELSSAYAGVTIPTSEGQNTLTVDTDLQPSEMTITYIKEGQ